MFKTSNLFPTFFYPAACEQVQEKVPVLTEEKTDEVKNKDVNPRESASVRQEMTEEDLEDWLDSMIS